MGTPRTRPMGLTQHFGFGIASSRLVVILRACASSGLFAVIGVLSIASHFAAPAPAMIVTTTSPLDTTVAPPDNPGWNNVTVGPNSRNFTYLGNGWGLSAWHVGPFIGQPAELQTLTFSTGVVSVIPNQIYIVPNPSGAGLSAETDLHLVRLSADPGLPSLTIAQTALTNANLGQPVGDVTFIGNGRTRESNVSTWSGHQGYYAQDDFTKRWGRNQIANDDTLLGGSDTDLRGTVNIGTTEAPRHIVSMFTKFDFSAGNYEAQAVDRDSGSAVFHKNGAQWELIGIVNTIYTYENQPAFSAFDGDYTSFADLTYYRSEILNIMNAHANYSVVGDINLDGVVTGNGTGSASTDDITAFVQGWGWQQGAANVTSWKKGDLNLDGTTNAADYFLMRNAAINAGLATGASALSNLFSPSGGVPEPSSLALVAIAASAAACRRRR